MDKRGKQTSKKRKFQVPEEDGKQNESILEEVLSISGKNVETSTKKDESSPVQLKRSANKKGKPIIEPKNVNAKKLPVSPPTSPPPKKKKFTHEKKVNTARENKKCNIKKGQPVPTLPDGWRRESVIRRSGKTAGQTDIYFYSPDGRKLRSRPDVASYLFTHNMDINLEKFDFSKKSKAVAKKKAKGNSAASIKKEKTQEVKVNEVELKNSKAMSKSPRKLSTKVPSLADAENKKDPDINEIDCKNSPKGMSAKKSKPEKLSTKVSSLTDTEEKDPKVNEVKCKSSKVRVLLQRRKPKPAENSPTKVPSLVDAEGRNDREVNEVPKVNEVECKSSSKVRVLVQRRKPKPSEKSPTKVPSLVDAEGKNDPEVNEVESGNSLKGMSAMRSKPTEKLPSKVPSLVDAEGRNDPEINEVGSGNSSESVSAKRSKPTEKLSLKVPANEFKVHKRDPDILYKELPNGIVIRKWKGTGTSSKVPPLANAKNKKDPEGKSNTVLIKILTSKPKKIRK